MTGFRYKQAQSVSEDAFAEYSQRLADADRHIKTGDGRGNDFLGWRDIGVRPGGEEHARILAAAKRIFEAELANTGYSMGPHLHLDVVETATDEFIDPLPFFAAAVSDHTAPTAEGIMVFPRRATRG